MKGVKKSTIIIRVDHSTKKESQEIARKMGVNLSVILVAYLKTLVRTKRITLSAEESGLDLHDAINDIGEQTAPTVSFK